MEFGNSQVRAGEEDVSEEVLVEDDTKDIEAPGELQRNDSVRGSNIASGSLNPIDVEESVELNQDGSFDEKAAAVATGAAVGAAATAAAIQQPPPRQVIVDEGYDGGINNNNTEAAAAAKNTSNNLPADDQCCTFRCCGYPNGAFPIMFAQLFLFCGLILSSWSVVDCKFVVATAGYPEPYIPQPYPFYSINGTAVDINGNPITPAPIPVPPPPTRRGFGFFFNETIDGGCGYTDQSRYFSQEELENYIDFLGNDWNIPRYLVSVASGVGWIFWWFLLLPMVCCTYIRAFRWMLAAVMIFVVGGLQASSFAVIGSSFCDDDTDCEPDRGLWIGVAGISCYLFAGLFFCMMKDFPGSIAAYSEY